MSEIASGATPRNDSLLAWAMVVVLCVAFVARLVEIGYNFDGDEIFSMHLVNGSWWDVITRSLADKPHPPLHNLLLHGWIGLFGVSETKLRLLSVILSVSGILVSLAILRPRVEKLIVLCCCLTLAISGFFVYEGQEARPYALIFFAGAFNIWAFLNVFANPQRTRSIVIWTGSAAVLVWSHYIGSLSLFVEGCLLLIRYPFRTAICSLAPATIAGTTILPWMWIAFRSTWNLQELAWNVPPTARDFPSLFIGAIGWPPVISGWILLGGIVVLIAIGVTIKFRSPEYPWDEVALTALAFLPPLVVFVVSRELSHSVWADRQLIPSALAFVLLVFMLVNSQPRVPRAIIASSIVIWAAAGSVDGHQSNSVPPWRNIVQRIENRNPHAIVLAYEPWTVRPLQYYTQNTRLRIVDAGTRSVSFGKGEFYVVCRWKQKLDPCDELLKKNEALRGKIEFAKDLWNTAGGKALSTIFTFRLNAGN